LGKRLQKYKERCREFWGACLLAGRTKKQESGEEGEVPPKKEMKGILTVIIWSLLIAGIAYFAFVGGRHLWVNIFRPIWIEDRAVGR
jgi:hypothetical protein